MKNYSLGFAFNEDLSGLLLIAKTHPAWQAGKLNGIGGRIEQDEVPADAMVREFFEETGLLREGWEEFGLMQFPEARVTCYCISTDITGYQPPTDEKVIFVRLGQLEVLAGNDGIIPNLRWLIPLPLWHLKRHAWINETFQYTGAPLC
jgi:8-oxo-dGTP diphosphatase